MADFSPENYFAQRVQKDTSGHSWDAAPDRSKHADVMRATEEKLNTLQAIGEAKKKDALSWSNQLGLHNSTVAGQLADLAGSVYSGTSRMAGDVAGFVAGDAPAMFNDLQLQEHESDAISRFKRGEATPEDITLINAKQIRTPEGATPDEVANAHYRANNDKNASTPLELFDRAVAARKRSSDINASFDRTDVLQSDRRDAFLYDLGDDFQAAWDQTGLGNLFTKGEEVGDAKNMAAGVAKLLYNAGEAALNHKMGSAQYIAENLPQLLIGGVRKGGKEMLGLTNVGYASENYQKGIEKYQAENQGALPPTAERQRMAFFATTTALAEHVTDTKLLDAIKGAKKVDVDGAAIRTGFKESLKNTGKATLTGIAAEAPTEAWQTYAEGEANLEGSTAKDIYVGGVIGGIAGGGMTGGGRAVAELTGATPEKAKLRQQEADKREVFRTAVEANDPSAFLDREATTYDPAMAVGVLMKHAQSDKATPETKAENLKRATEIVSDLDSSLESELVTYATNSENTAEDLAGYQELVVKNQTRLAELDPADPANAGEIDYLTQQVVGVEAMIAGSQPAALKLKKLELDKMQRDLSDARKLTAALSGRQSAPVNMDVANATVDVADTTAIAASRAAVDNVITLSMHSPGSVSHEEMTQLADNKNNLLTEPERKLLRVQSAAQIAENLLKGTDGVDSNIYFGSKAGAPHKYVGIKEYQQKVGEAIAAGNQAKAITILDTMKLFAKDHKSKAKAITTAYSQFLADKNKVPVQVRSSGKNTQSWYINTGDPLELSALRAEGGLSIKADSVKLNRSIPIESDALNSAHAAMRQAIELKFGKAASPTPAAQTPAAPSSAASVESTPADIGGGSSNTKADTEQAVEAPAVTAEAVEVKQEKKKDSPKPEGKPVDSAPLDRTGENPGSTLRPTETVGDATQEATKETKSGSLVKALQDATEQMLLVEQMDDSIDPNASRLEHDPTVRDKYQQANKVATQAYDALYAETSRMLSRMKSFGTAYVTELTEQLDALASEEEHDSKAEQLIELYKATKKYAKEFVQQQPSLVMDEAPVASPDGTLKVFAKRIARVAGETMNQLYATPGFNQVAQFLKQDKTNEQDASTRPLVAVEAFITNWTAGNVNVEDYLDLGKGKNKRELTDEEVSALKNLREFIAEWMPKLEKSFNLDQDTQAAFRSDRMQDLLFVDPVTGKVVSEENVKAAIAYAMYSYILDRANSPALHTKKEVAEMHKALLKQNQKWDEERTKMTPDGLKMLQEMDVTEETLVNDLGQRALQALGLKARDKDTPVDLIPKLIVSLGTHAMFGLAQGKRATETSPRIPGFIEIVAVPQNDVHEIFEIDPLPNKTKNVWKDGKQVFDKDGNPVKEEVIITLSYIRFNYAPETRANESINKYGLTDKVRAIRDAVVGSHGVVDKLFSVEHTPREALTEPTENKQDYAKGTKQEVSKAQKKAINDTQHAEHRVVQGMWNMLDKLGEMTFLIAAGWKDVNQEDPNYHAVNRPGIDAQNRNLEDQIDQAMDMAGKKHGLDKVYYVIQSVWRNFRAGFSNGSLNQQSSKIHRYLFSRPEWTVNIKFDDAPMVNEFLISIAMAMGKKTDQQRNHKSLSMYFTGFDEAGNLSGVPVLKDAAVMDAVELIRKVNFEEYAPSEAEKVLIQEAAVGAEGMMSLQAMLAFAEYQQAMKLGKQDFEFTMLVGADGKTNGPMLTLFALGAAGYDTLNRGGFYSTEPGQPVHYSEYAERSDSMDMYQDTGLKMYNNIEAKTFNDTPEQLEARRKKHKALVKKQQAHYLDVPISTTQVADLLHLTGNLYDSGKQKVESALRNLIKTPLTAFFFGSSTKNAAKSMENAFIESWYETIEKIKQGKAKNGMTLESFINATNGMIKTGDPAAPLIPMNMEATHDEEAYIDAAMRYTLHTHKEQEAALRKGFQLLMGNSVRRTFDTVFNKFIIRRGQITQSVHAAHAVYLLAYEDAKQKLIKDLIAKGEMPFRPTYKFINKVKTEIKGEEIALRDLTVGEEAQLQESLKALRPVAHNAMSLAEGNLDAGSYMGSETKDPSQSVLYKAAVMLKGQKRVNGAMIRKMVNNGVGSLSAFIHSLDAANMHMALLRVLGSMNVHDEIGNGVDKIGGKDGAATAINQTTSVNLLNFSPAREAYNLLERTALAFAQMAQREDFDPKLAQNVAATWMTPEMEETIAMHEVFGEFLTDAFHAAYAADRDRLTMLTQLAYTDQYTWEGGHYKIDEAFRARAQAMLDALPKDMPNEVLVAIKDLSKEVLRAEKEGSTVTRAVDPDAEVDDDGFNLSDPAPEPAADDQVTAENASDHSVMHLLEDSTDLKAQDLLKALIQRFANNSRDRKSNYHLHLAEQLYKNPVFKDLQVSYEPRPEAAGTARGQYRHWDNKDEHSIVIYTDVTTTPAEMIDEVLLHEMLHAALARMLKKNGKAVNPDASIVELTDELEMLRAKALEHVADKPKLKRAFQKALANIDEFISYGMTNKEFQDQVLTQISMSSMTTKNKLVTGMELFINAITKVFFPNKKANLGNEVDGMSLLIQNVAGLLDKANSYKHLDNNTGSDVVNTLEMASASTGSYTTQGLYEALDTGAVDSAFNDHLQNLLGTIVEKLHGPFGSFKEQFMGEAAATPEDKFLKAKSTGIAPFASRIPAMMGISSQEAFVLEQVEATVQAALNDDIASSKQAYRELAKLYREAEQTFSAEDFFDGNWATASPDQQAAAQATYDFVFKMEANGNRTDYLSRFAALGLAHQRFNKMLQVASKTTTTIGKKKTFSEHLQSIFDAILEMWNTRITTTFSGQHMDLKLNALVSQLVDIEASRRVAEEQRSKKKQNVGEVLDDKLSAGVGVVVDKLEEFGRSGFFQNRKSGAIRAAGHAGSMILGNRLPLFLKQMSDLRDRNNAGAPGFLAGMLNDFKGFPTMFKGMVRMAKNREKQVTHVATQTGFFAMGGFINDGRDLSQDSKDAVTAVVLRTGVHSLLGRFDMQQLEHLLGNKAAMEKAIADEVQKLGKFPRHIHYFIKQAKYLAAALVTEQDKGAMVMKNAGNIARLYGVATKHPLTEAQAVEAEATLDVLTTLYALSYSYESDLDLVRAVLKKENARDQKTNPGNGIEALLHLHQALEQQARERNFEGSEALMSKAYLPDITNPHIDIVTADDATDGVDLLDQGYRLGGQVMKDKNDPDQAQKSLYVLNDAGKQPLLTSIIGYQGMAAAGTSATKGNAAEIRRMYLAKQAEINQMFLPDPTFNPMLAQGNNASPVLNAKGEIADWNYRMHRNTRNVILQRDNSFDKLLGQLAGTTYDKATVTESNTMAIQGAYQMYQEEIADNPHAYIEVSGSTDNAEMREIYRLLPDATKRAIKDIWGNEPMLIRKDSLDILFGYHKLSAADRFEKIKDPETGELIFKNAHNFVDAAIVMVVEHMLDMSMHAQNVMRRAKGLPLLDKAKYRRRAGMVVRKYERIWQELVKEMKDIIVVKTGVVMVANIVSNFILLKMNGVSMVDMVQSSLIAFRGAREYQRDTNQLFKLETQVESGFVTGDIRKVEREIVRLRDAISRNPVKGMIDAGMLPTIAEDVEATNDKYSYKSALVRKADKYTGKLHPKVVAAGKLVYMSKDGKMYKALSEITQLSDFVAKYALHQHLTTRTKNPLTSAAALQEAADAFISYDIPMHRKMQYSDDMGFTMFSKYFIRVQHVIMKLAKEHPGNLMIAMLLDNYIMNLPNIMESAMLTRLGGNPFGLGAVGLPGVIPELATVNAALSPFTSSVGGHY